MEFKIFSISDIGNIREGNEDSYLELAIKDKDESGMLIVVADGMGGHKAGEVASQLVTTTIEEYVKNGESNSYTETLRESINKANSNVLKMAEGNPECHGMGSTCTALLIISGKAYLAHVGDSRAYLIRNDKALQLTSDHTVAEQMRISGNMSREHARRSPQRNILTNAVGIREDIEIDVLEPFEVLQRDLFLLCSDGLSEYVEDQELANITEQHEPEEACKLLVDIAKNRGGGDNITVQILKVLKQDQNSKKNIFEKIFYRS